MVNDPLQSQPIISVVVTCYNDGIYLDEALASVKNSTFKKYEIIIVDDCSTDDFTISKLDALEKEGYIIKRKTKNKGLGNSRNEGIAIARGKYILPLDADDRINPTYLEKAVDSLANGNDVVYCNVKNFGEINSVRIAPEFSFHTILAGNYIASCSAFTKKIWEQTRGYDESLECYEDWNFWIDAAEKNAKFLKLNEALFEYRRKKTSMSTRSQDPAIRYKIVQYICNKHNTSYEKYAVDIIPVLHRIITELEIDIKNLDAINKDGSVVELYSRLTDAENLLAHRTAYYENSIFWKLKKIVDKFRGRK